MNLPDDMTINTVAVLQSISPALDGLLQNALTDHFADAVDVTEEHIAAAIEQLQPMVANAVIAVLFAALQSIGEANDMPNLASGLINQLFHATSPDFGTLPANINTVDDLLRTIDGE